MNDTIITLPNADEMMRRLRSVMDETHAVANLYPNITKHAGEQKTPEGINLMVMLAVYDYADGLPTVVIAGLEVIIPDLVQALTSERTRWTRGDKLIAFIIDTN
jgi:hypothetical protein